MNDLLRSVNSMTKFRILVEIARNQPDVQQRDIAGRLGLSVQAISDYVRELTAEGRVETQGRSKYRITVEGMDWLMKGVGEWDRYSHALHAAIRSIAASPAIAGDDLSEGQRVGLEMRDGLIFATRDSHGEASGIAISHARTGEDVGVVDIEGIVPLKVSPVTILRQPSIRNGGSRQVDLKRLKERIKDKQFIGAVGLESLVSLRKQQIEPSCFYGVQDAVIEAARSGLSTGVVCVDDAMSDLVGRLEEKRMDYEIVEIRRR